ncbi:MAG TPA: lytic murein transglycosylase [Gaiellaceae bacterium]|nr:lytic murein transglycosylase [Gaiellaceae bacterium]
MKRLTAAVILALALSGSAGADVFTIVPSTPSSPAGLPSASVPNAPGSISFSLTPPAVPEVLSYPQLLAIWQQAGAAYGVQWQVLEAINKVESNFGRNMGPSSAGAIGWMQFLPSTWERWGVDANGDGVADPWNAQDAITAAARYLAAAGGRTDIAGAIFSYNHAQWYVDEVLQLAGLFGSGGVDATFTLDRLQVSLDHARGAVVHANRKLVAAERLLRARVARESALRARADQAEVLSDRLTLQKRTVQAGVVRASAQARVRGLRAVLAKAREELASARDRSLASSFSPAAGTMLGAPAYDGSYVFPVGGGPSVVSVSHHHHDYPAADIAAPLGSPIYALADAVVLRSWQYPGPRCGIGMTIQTDDGQTWTYCHMSYLDPSMTAGVRLAAGTQVGLVGMTGDASGPHLHLQLDPPLSYPQLQPWFQRFANVAFRWQDAGPTDAAAQGPPVFAVVPAQASPRSGPVVLFTR